MQEAVSPAADAAPQEQWIAGLRLPPPSLSSLSCGCANERQLFRWLIACDLQPYRPADRQRLVDMLFVLIGEIARWQAPAPRRLAMLELLRQYTLACVDSMALQHATFAGAQTIELRKSVLAAMRLLLYLGRAFAGAAVQLAGPDGVGLLAREKCARSLQRAVDVHRRTVRLHTLFGLVAPENTWRDMQLLVQLGRRWKLADKKVRDTRHPRNRDSAAGAYLQAALFASANPVQLAADEQERFWNRTCDWARAGAIVDRYTGRANALLASLALDQPPVPANRLGNCPVDLRHFSGSRGWKVDLGGVLALLERQRRRRRDPLLEHARQIWAQQTGRGERRTPVQRDCDIAIGISAICHHLGGRGKLPGKFFDGAAPDGDHLCLEVDAVDFHSGQTLGEYAVALPPAPGRAGGTRARRRAGERYRLERANLLNSSDRGMGLSLPLSSRDRLRVGDLLGLRLDGAWQLAVVRWQHTLPDHCRAGVEALVAGPLPVEVQRHTAAGHLSAPISGLLVKAVRGKRASLLLPVPLFKCYDTVELQGRDRSRAVTLERQTLATGSFAGFEFV
ncbi:hypothetical protein [Microbulbifer halophilus]|uniref:GTPase n=1 Tax=Microbulbifer halophilus TaxID=453963 RepID=A0ABW5E9K1_9GAMM|nr:hypothetical protein [Microbulbifer halophilus]MCW8126120.1 hypothetical protein [Microbulbifer halophilus]